MPSISLPWLRERVMARSTFYCRRSRADPIQRRHRGALARTFRSATSAAELAAATKAATAAVSSFGFALALGGVSQLLFRPPNLASQTSDLKTSRLSCLTVRSTPSRKVTPFQSAMASSLSARRITAGIVAEDIAG
jgi:hypothetical protein